MAALAVSAGACRRREPAAPPVATPQVVLSRATAPLGSPIDITYRFVVASDAHFTQDYRVMLHVVDSDDELMWTDDHNPPTPTTEWKPGQTIQYTRTVFIPVYPYVGDASLRIGLYSTADQKRLPLSGQDDGQRAYTVAHLRLDPQTGNPPIVFKDGWHAAEVAEHNQAVQWQWTKKDATIAFRNPRKDCVFYLDADNPGGVFHDTQQVQVSVAGGPVVDRFALAPKEQVLRKVRLTAAQLGTGSLVELHIVVDKTFVPALLDAAVNKDPRELGIRVFHAYVDAR
ncbi:MAG: hypothetical protein ACM3SQ_19210 [Betaproteobacteria bacterium]